MRQVCFVTDELHPFTAGGIGRLIHNLIRHAIAEGDDVRFHLLFPSHVGVTPHEVAAVFGEHVVAHFAHMRSGWATSFSDDGQIYAPSDAYTDCREHAQSVDFLIALRNLADEGLRFDWVEFPDWHGWAYATLQEKRLDPAFPHSEVVVRLHGTAGIIEHFEGDRMTIPDVGLRELERKALHDADRVIAHLPPVADFYRDFYGFTPEWRERVGVQFPPLDVTHVPASVRARRDLLFITKIQPLKRPDLFVRGAALFMQRNPDFSGHAIFACHIPQEEHWASVRDLIPAELADRFSTIDTGKARDTLIPGNIVIIPSEYESLCLSAYEASAAGASLVLNGACPAFGDGTPFGAPDSCRRFDGTARGLADAIGEAWRSPPGAAPAHQVDPPYWREAPAARATPARARDPKVTVLLTNYNLGRYLPEALASVAASSHLNVEVVLVDDASSDPFDRDLLDRLESDGSVRVVRNPVNLGLAASRNVGLDAATGDYVLPLDADDCIGPDFLALGVAALERHREFDVVVPQTAFFETDEDLAARRFCDYAIFLGDAPSLGLIVNRLSTATSLMRRSALERFRYDEKLNAFEDWNLYLRMAVSGVRFLTTNTLQFFYRRRPESMMRGVDPVRHHQLMVRTLESLPRPLPAWVQIFPLVLPTLELAMQRRASDLDLRHRLVDQLDEHLKRVPFLQPVLRRLTLQLQRIVGRA